ncbi:conserved hypothetical protein [Hyphomicrobiales bacterium]|jgi:hypothetical protein|nr:conserved hypothetical protein [Hyphomicrobiales bacterium]CAH1702920.1 conserved hypothetical protein [Hyphomicrobiales bacterium]CAI0347106.1 conserved hypothetical protein [Hyphomicrobiales bacterium]
MSSMDAEVFRAAFEAHTSDRVRGEPNFFTRRMAILLADMDGTKPRDAVLRCEALGLLRVGAWSWFVRNGGITSDQVEQVRSERIPDVA